MLDDVEVFATCPQSADVSRAAYLQRVVDVARWSESAGCKGMLVYTDNRLVDPWLVSQVVVQNTDRLSPLVAIQPVYMHPYTVAKMVTSLGNFYERKLYLNMVAGGFKNDLIALNDNTPHDKRYDRLVEYTSIIKDLLSARSPVTFRGDFYKIEQLGLTPPLPRELMPGVFVSGSSEAGLAAARALGAVAVKYPKPPSEDQGVSPGEGFEAGIRVGIITRDDEDQAWRVARERFPEDRVGQVTHMHAMKVSDSVWHKQLSNMGGESETDSPYWLVPFKNYKTFCPYLVGAYERVAAELSRYISLGYKTFILDIPPMEDELHYTGVAFRRALEMTRE